MKTTQTGQSDLPAKLATDGRMIVEEVDGRSFWSGQPYIADCLVSESYRQPGTTERHASTLVHRWNCHADLLEALRRLLEVADAGEGLDGYAMDAARAAIRKATEGGV